MSLTTTLALIAGFLAAALFCGWRGARPPNLIRGPRMIPWRILMVASAATYYVVNIAPGMATEVICTFDSGTPTPLRALSVFLYPGASASASTGTAASSSATGQHPIPALAPAQHPSIANPAKPGKA
jgi:hypothetical protein